MVVKFYDLKSIIEDELTRIEEHHINQTKSIHIDYHPGTPGYMPTAPEAKGYYTVSIETFNGDKFTV